MDVEPLDRLVDPPQLQGPERARVEAAAHQGHGGGAGHDRPRLGRALEAGGDVERLAHGHGGPTVGAAELAHHGGTAVDPDPHGQRVRQLERFHRRHDVECRSQRLCRVVVVGLRPAEPEEDAVPAVALDVTAEGPSDPDRPVLIGLDQLAVVLGVGGGRELRWSPRGRRTPR